MGEVVRQGKQQWRPICAEHDPENDHTRSTYALDLKGQGVLVREEFKNDIDEVSTALQFIPNIQLYEQEDGTWTLGNYWEPAPPSENEYILDGKTKCVSARVIIVMEGEGGLALERQYRLNPHDLRVHQRWDMAYDEEKREHVRTTDAPLFILWGKELPPGADDDQG